MTPARLSVLLIALATPASLPAAERAAQSDMVSIPAGPFTMGSNDGP
jgi:formylglycine-generating enzyme required for sulfatase activity